MILTLNVSKSFSKIVGIKVFSAQNVGKIESSKVMFKHGEKQV